MTNKSRMTKAERIAKDSELMRRQLGHIAAPHEPTAYLDVGSAEIHAALGCADLGLPYGKMYEIAGEESHGKTALTLGLAAKAQEQGAEVVWYSAEPWGGDKWARGRGLVRSKIYLIEQEVILKNPKQAEGERHLSSAEEKFAEMEWYVKRIALRDASKNIFVAVDSTAALLTREEIDTGFQYNMRTNSALAMFLSRSLKRWNALCHAHNILFVLVNQIRTKPGVAFGDPRYTPGGKAIKFYCSSRAYISRAKGGRLTRAGKTIGIKGYITNIKNKLGEGSVEGTRIGYKLFFEPGKADVFFNESQLKRD